ncbi:MAG: MarR family transcriptional regulator [candidate division WOR-3 bacterium]
MKNRIVGFIILGIAILIGFIIYSFNKALTDIVNTSCSHGPECPMWGSIDFQTNISIGIMVFIIIIGLYMIFFGQEEKIVMKIKRVKINENPQKVDLTSIMKKLNNEEKRLVQKLVESDGAVFQSDLVEKTGFSKVKVTRILDRLEGMGIVERKRRGMTNIVIIKNRQTTSE